MRPVSILDEDFDQQIERLPHDEARASMMEHALRAQINERIHENPAFYERLSDTLGRIIRELRERLIDAAEACKRMAEVRAELGSEAATAAAHGLTPVSFAVYGILARAAPNGARAGGERTRVAEEPGEYLTDVDEALGGVAGDIEAVLERHRAVIEWHDNLDVQREMRRDIKRLLRDSGRHAEDELDELVGRIVEVARRRIA